MRCLTIFYKYFARLQNRQKAVTKQTETITVPYEVRKEFTFEVKINKLNQVISFNQNGAEENGPR